MSIFLVGIMFGLAMDYDVFLVSQIREFHLHGERPRQAVVSGFLGAEDSLIKMLAFGLTVAVLLDAFVIRMTLVPAALALLGDRAWRLPTWLDRTVSHIDRENASEQ